MIPNGDSGEEEQKHVLTGVDVKPKKEIVKKPSLK